MGQQFKMDDDNFFDDLVEYDTTKLDTSDNSVEALNQIAGGDYWKLIIEQYLSGKINGYEAEENFSEQYCLRLSQSYTYVLNMADSYSSESASEVQNDSCDKSPKRMCFDG